MSKEPCTISVKEGFAIHFFGIIPELQNMILNTNFELTTVQFNVLLISP